jgi:hypothetical protein
VGSPVLLPESQMRSLPFWAVNHFITLSGILTLIYGSIFMDKGRLRAFLKDPLLKELENYSTGAETGYE